MIQNLTRRMATQLPVWARPATPGLRYAMAGYNALSRKVVIQQIVAIIIIYALSIVVFHLLEIQLGRSLSEQLITLLFWPTVFLQWLLSLAVIVYTSGAIGIERRNNTWDSLRATDEGVNVTLRAHWSSAVFYRQPVILGAIYLVRLILLGAIIYDLTAFRGDYLHYLTGGIIPEISPVAGIILLALTMTASFVLPLTGLGLDAALGLIISTFLRQRVFLGLTQIVILVIRLMISTGFIALIMWVMEGTPLVSTAGGLGALVGFGALGDWGLRYLHLAFLGETWHIVNYAIFTGVGLLFIAFIQALLADGLLAWATHRAQRRD